MGTAAGASPYLHLATGSYQTAGAQFLAIKWTAEGTVSAGICVKVRPLSLEPVQVGREPC